MERLNKSRCYSTSHRDWTGVVMASRTEQYRQLAHDFHFMARSLPDGQNRSTLLKMAEECERLADQQEQPTDLRSERSYRR